MGCSTSIPTARPLRQPGTGPVGVSGSRGAVIDRLAAQVEKAEGTLKKAGQFGAETAHTKSVNWTMNPDPAQRPTAKEALKHSFLADRLLDDTAAQAVLKKVLGDAPEPEGVSIEGSVGGQPALGLDSAKFNQL